jgi:transposase
MSHYISGEDRRQGILFPVMLEDYVSQDNPVRVIDAFVDELDMKKLGFKNISMAQTGRPAYNPKDLLKLYIYGYLNYIRSSRRFEIETYRNVEVMWLIRKLHPDFKTIADFRKDNKKALKGVFRIFNRLYDRLGLFGKELIVVDGSKFKAMNSRKKNYTKDKLEKLYESSNKKFEEYVKQLDEADDNTDEGPNRLSKEEIAQKIEVLDNKQAEYKELLEELSDTGESQISFTDPDSRAMSGNPKVDVGYNVQIAVDDKNHLIVEQTVRNDRNDLKQFSEISIKAKEALQVETIKSVADLGYYDSIEIKKAEDNGIESYIPKPKNGKAQKGIYLKEDFKYNPDKDCYICPAGKELTKYTSTVTRGKVINQYSTKACKNCKLRSKCTQSKEDRRIGRWESENVLERVADRVKAHPEIIEKRKEVVEHVFGTIKFGWGYGHFLTKGIENIRTEFTLSALAYNLKRVINIIGVRNLIKSLLTLRESRDIILQDDNILKIKILNIWEFIWSFLQNVSNQNHYAKSDRIMKNVPSFLMVNDVLI